MRRLPAIDNDIQLTEKPPKRLAWSATRSLGVHISFTVTQPSLIVGGVLAALLLTLVLVHTPRFLQAEVTQGTLLYVLCLIASVLIGLIAAVRIDLPQKAEVIVNTVIVLLLPIVAMTMAECLNGVFTWDWSPRTLFLNYILYMLFYGAVYVFSGSYRLPMLMMNGLFFILALTNYYVKAFRGTPFIPMDLFAAGTAANVAAAYDFSFNYQVVIAVLLLVFLTVTALRMRTPRMHFILKVASRVFFGVLTVCIVSIYLFTDLYAQAGLSPDFWSQNRGYRKTGVVMNFCLNTKYISVKEPAGYDADKIEGIVTDAIGDNNNAVGNGVTPNIICIMNESLSDLSVLGDLETNVDYMPFLRNLTENTVRGNLYVPVIGASTSNSEFEFLTGAPMSFFPAGSNAFMLYVKNPLYSLVSTLGAQNYTQLAFHPYYASGWNRPNVYKNLGFNRFDSINSIISYDTLIAYQNSGYSTAVLEELVAQEYPYDDVLLRRYVSDSYDYKKIIEMYENRDAGQPFFLFNVTMQNHGGYTEKTANFTEDVYVTGINGVTDPAFATAYPKANQYLSLIKASDAAFEELVNYFALQDEPTIICMFGDHQPNVESAFVNRLQGVSSELELTTEQLQQQYITPFYIWANYDIEEREIDRLGANYLSSYMMQVAGVEMPAYNQYLLKLSETLPVVNTVGVIDAEGNHYALGSKTPYDTLIADYKKVVHNLIFDEKNRCDSIFAVN